MLSAWRNPVILPGKAGGLVMVGGDKANFEFLLPVLILLWLAANLLVLPVYLMPLRYLFAYLRAPVSKAKLNAFRTRQRENPARHFRYLVGMWYLAVFIALLFLLGLLVAMKADQPSASLLLSVPYLISIVLLVIAFFVGFVLPPATYLYEFYRVPGRKRIWSFSYLFLILYNLSFPVTAVILIYAPFSAAVEDLHFLPGAVSEDTAVIDRPNSRFAFRLAPHESACNRALAVRGLRMTNPKWYGPITKNDEIDIVAAMFLDQYIRGVTFDAPAFFGCSFTDIEPNTDDVPMSLIMLFYRACISLFSIGVYALLLQRLWERVLSRFTRRLGRPAAPA
jgi:hypothetical protein